MRERYELSRELLHTLQGVWDEEGESFSFVLFVLSQLQKEDKLSLRHDEEKNEWIVKIP